MDTLVGFIKKILLSRMFRAAAIGGVAVLCQTMVFELLAVYLRVVTPSTAVLIGSEFGILTNFFLNHRLTFRDRVHAISLPRRLLAFHVVVSGSVVIQWLFVFIAEHMTASLSIIHAAYAAGVVTGFVSNYIGYHAFVWKHPETPSKT